MQDHDLICDCQFISCIYNYFIILFYRNYKYYIFIIVLNIIKCFIIAKVIFLYFTETFMWYGTNQKGITHGD